MRAGALGAAIEDSTPRSVTVAGRELLSFAGCNYLGLAHHPTVLAAARRALDSGGLGMAASRTTSGNHVEYEELESALARFLGTEAALLCTDGCLADLALLQSLATADPAAADAPPARVALIDSQAHACLRQAARCAGLEVYEYGAGDLKRAHALLDRHGERGVTVLTDGAFPMQGRLAQANELLRHLPRSGTLVLDDSHGLGVLGKRGGGIREAFDLNDPRLILTASLAKGLGCAGGVVAGAAERVQAVRCSDAWLTVTPVPPAVAAATRAAVAVLEAEPERVARLQRRSADLHALVRRLGRPLRGSFLPVVPLEVASREEGERLQRALADDGIFVPLVVYPGAPAQGVLRLAVTSEHEAGDLERLEAALERHR